MDRRSSLSHREGKNVTYSKSRDDHLKFLWECSRRFIVTWIVCLFTPHFSFKATFICLRRNLIVTFSTFTSLKKQQIKTTENATWVTIAFWQRSQKNVAVNLPLIINNGITLPQHKTHSDRVHWITILILLKYPLK